MRSVSGGKKSTSWEELTFVLTFGTEWLMC